VSYLQAAFDHIIQDSDRPKDWYVCLIEEYKAYGGPEEGGWYQTMRSLEAYKSYPSLEMAEEIANHVREFAKELENESRRNYGEHCLYQMEWLEERGLDADYLPEDDGPSNYRVIVCDELPVYDNTRMQYS
jgi:hypothetical protein